MSFIADMFAKPLAAGASVPEITVSDQDGSAVDLGALFRTGVSLLYFYPKADTPGCTAQACSLRDGFQELSDLGVRIYGVSGDGVAGQKKFQAKYRLPFPLLADADKRLARAFGVPMLLQFTARHSFLIRDGKVLAHIPNARTGKHAAEVRSLLSKLL